MRIQKIYIDTSVLGGYFDIEFDDATRRLFDEVKKGEYKIVVSNITEGELLNAPERVRTLLNDLNIDYELITLTDDAVNLALEYIRENVIGQTSYDDCLHIAIATISRLDLLVSWNFKHIVNIKRIRGYNGINIKNGYPSIEIRSPKDLIDYETTKDFDCVKMMRDIRDKVNSEIIKMDSVQIIEYFRKKSKEYESKYGQSVTRSRT